MNKILAATVIKAHGIKGTLKIQSYLEDFQEYLKFILDTNDLPVEITHCSLMDEGKNQYLVALKNINNLESTVGLIKKNWYIEEKHLPKVEENNFYYYKLIGLPILDEQENPVGIIKDICNLGAGDIIVIKLNINKIVYLPFDNTTFPIINENNIIISELGLKIIFNL